MLELGSLDTPGTSEREQINRIRFGALWMRYHFKSELGEAELLGASNRTRLKS